LDGVLVIPPGFLLIVISLVRALGRDGDRQFDAPGRGPGRRPTVRRARGADQHRDHIGRRLVRAPVVFGVGQRVDGHHRKALELVEAGDALVHAGPAPPQA